MAAVLVHIDLDGDRPHASSLAALTAGRAVASSWGATLYAALIAHDPAQRRKIHATTEIVSTAAVPGIAALQTQLARAGADKVVVALSDAPVAPLWAAIGASWQGVLDHLRPRLVLFGADAPSAAELGPRTGARIGARLLLRARAVGVEEVELRDRDGGYVRASDGGAAVALIGGAQQRRACDEDIDLVVLAAPGGVDDRIEVAGSAPGEVGHTGGAIVVLGDDVADDLAIRKDALRLAKLIGAHLLGGAAAARAGAIAPGAVVDRDAALAPELCVVIGTAHIEVAGATSLVRIGSAGGKGIDGALAGPIEVGLGDLCRALEGS